MIKIYKLFKENDPMTVYIGQTGQSLEERLYWHKKASKKQVDRDRKVYQWFDDTVKIKEIEEYSGNEPNIREMEVVQEHIADGYTVMNIRVGDYILDPKTYIKSNNDKHHALYKANGKQKIDNDKSNSSRTTKYHNWSSNICIKAKKEGLSSKEYRIKYNIPDFSGPKKK